MKSRRVVHTAAQKREFWPGANELPWDLDLVARQLVYARGPKGFTLDEVGVCLGVTRERARHIEEGGLRKLGILTVAEGTVDELRDLMNGESV